MFKKITLALCFTLFMAALPLVTYAGGHTGGTHNFAILEDNSLWGCA